MAAIGNFSAHDWIIGIATSLIAFFLTVAGRYIIDWFGNHSVEKRFQIAGTYITKYIDKGATVTELLKLKQKGRRIRGETITNPDQISGARKWLFDGTVVDAGYLQGGYRPESAIDTSFGAFFMRIDRNSDMRGYWLGRDANETTIQQGEYSFRRQPEFSIAAIDISDQVNVLKIAEDQLGDGYIGPKDLEADAKKIAICVKVGGTAVGFATARMIATPELLARIGDSLPDPSTMRPLENRLTGRAEVGFIGSVAVAAEFTGRGLGAELIDRCIGDLKLKGASVLVSTAWKSRNSSPAGSILECRGFQKLLEVPDYWTRDSVSSGYKCPVCGSPPCHCAAVVYVRNASSRASEDGTKRPAAKVHA